MNPTDNNQRQQGNVRPATQQQILATLRNQFGAAEGSLLPPRQIGSSRVPIVSNLKVGQVTSFIGGTQFILTFQQPTTGQNNQIDHFNVYVAGVNGNLNQLNGPNTCSNSPATVRVTTVIAQQVVFYVQTVLKNGLVSPIALSPTCTSQTVSGNITSSDIPPGTIGLSQLAPETAGSLISFTSGQVPTLITPVASGALLVSNGTTVPPAYFSSGNAGQILSTQGSGLTPLWINPVTLAFTSTADKTVGNTVTATSIVGTGVGSMTLAANFLNVGRTILIKARGYISSLGSSGGVNTTIRIQFNYGSTVILDTTVVSAPSAINQGVNIEAIITGRTTGVSGSVAAQGVFNNIGNFPLANTSPVTIDTTSSNLIDVLCTWSAASVSNSLTITNLYMEVLN